MPKKGFGNGSKLYQQRAKAALPLLVSHAGAWHTVTYGQFARELGMPNHRNLNHVLGAIGWELEALGKKWGEEIPAINCIVVNKGNQTPGRGIQFHMSIADYKKLPKHIQKQELAKLHREIDVNAGENVTDALMGDPMRRALVQIQSIFAELDKNLLLAKLRKARERTRQSEGRCEGRKRFGTRPGEQEIIQKIETLAKEGNNYSQIADQLNRDSVPTRAGKQWYPSTVANILTRK